MGHQLIQDITGQHVSAKGLFAHDVGNFRLGAIQRVLQFEGKVPAVGTLNAVGDWQIAALARGQVFLGVGVLGKKHPVPGLGVGFGNLGQMCHIGLCLLVCQRAGDKILLHIHHDIKGDFLVFHNCLLLFHKSWPAGEHCSPPAIIPVYRSRTRL